MAEDRKPVLTGGCQCGAIRYALREEPARPLVCHCRMCQKAVGGPFAVFTGLNKSALSWTRGTPSFFRSSSTSERGFCPDCGTPLTFAFLDRDRIDITIHTLDDPSSVAAPDRQVGTESRAPWLDHINSFPGESTEEFSGADFVRTCVNRQHPDHETPDGWTPET